MRVLSTKSEIQASVQAWKEQGETIGFVPTMGALHAGHLSLMSKSAESCDRTVVSIFVNPTQFNDPKDLEKYPRNLEKDVEELSKERVDLLFVPQVSEIYPNGLVSRHFDFGSVAESMEALNRPGHFDGVGTVVSALFDCVLPHRAFFGEKDFQQLMVIKRLVSLENKDIEIVGCPILRETNGLAMSSRNELLSAGARSSAAVIHESLLDLQANFQRKEFRALHHDYRKAIEASGGELEYLEIRRESDLKELVESTDGEPCRAFVVVRFEGIRLLDNLRLNP
jgi:pantoate--beta-alanine ligase